MSLSDQKAAFRLRVERTLPGPGLRPAMDASIVRFVQGYPAYRAAERVALYSPICNEPDISALFHTALAEGKTVCFPLCDKHAAALRFFAVRERCPVTIFLICGILPLVPGAGIYWTCYYLVTGQLDEASTRGFSALKAAVAIVLGIVFVFEIPQRFFKGKAVRKNDKL